MLEFTSISVSSYEASTLPQKLQESSTDGWSVVSIVNSGSDIVAYLSRPISVSESQTATAAPAQEPAESGDVGWGMQSGASTSAESAAASTSASSTPSSAAAPAGWYADPSGRFELRYWNGDK